MNVYRYYYPRRQKGVKRKNEDTADRDTPSSKSIESLWGHQITMQVWLETKERRIRFLKKSFRRGELLVWYIIITFRYY